MRHFSATAEHDTDVTWVPFPVCGTHPLLSAPPCTGVYRVGPLPVKTDLYGLFLLLGLVSPGIHLSISHLWGRDITCPRLILAIRVDCNSRKKKSQGLSESDTNINSGLLCGQHGRKWGSLEALLAKAASLTCAVNPTLAVEGGLR